MPALTVTPSFSEDAEGNQTVDFEVHKPFAGYQSSDTEYVTDNQGKQHHIMQDVELSETEVAFSPDGYDQLCRELYGPDLDKAIQWASKSWDPTKVELYDQAVNGDDFSARHQYMEMLLQDYYATGKSPTVNQAKSGSQEQAMSEQVSNPNPTPQSLSERAHEAYGNDDSDDYDISEEDEVVLEASFESLSPDQQQDVADLINNGTDESKRQVLELLYNHYHSTHS